MTKQDKIELGKLLDRHRITLIHYFGREDVYLIRRLDSRDKKVSDDIKGSLLD